MECFARFSVNILLHCQLNNPIQEEFCMPFPYIRAAAAGICLAFTASGAFASADDTIKARQACMKANGALMAVSVPVMKGEKPYDAAAIAAAFDVQGKACADWANFWSEESITGTGTVEHFAKPEILTDKAGFEKVSAASYTALQALKATTDEASFKAAFGAVGAGCKGCHEAFRRPKD
jgi:cytochrome c556